MYINVRRLIIFTFFLIFLCVVVTGPLFTMGAREDRLMEAEQMIQERRYNEAIELLSTIMKEEPRMFEEAEELMAEVRRAREAYNNTYNKLIEILDIQEGETLNEQEAYDIIKRLEELDADPNVAAVEAFAQARRSIVFTVNDQRFQGIMNEAEQLLADERYTDAVETYLSGFNLHREIFEEDDYGLAIEARVDSVLEEIRGTAGDYNRLFSVYRDRMQDFSRETEMVDVVWGELQAVFKQLYEDWLNIHEGADAIEQLRISILDAETTDIPFLSTLRVLNRGRPASEKPNGIAGAIERLLVDSLGTVSSHAFDLLRSEYVTAVELYASGDLIAAERGFQSALNFIDTILPFYERWNDIHNRRAELGVERKIGATVEETRSENIFVQTLENSAARRIELIQLVEGLNEIEGIALTAEAIEDIEVQRDNLVEILQDLTDQKENVAETFGSYDDYVSRGVRVDRSTALLTELTRDFDDEISRARMLEGALFTRIVRLRYTPREGIINAAEEDLETARIYVDGFEDTVAGIDELIQVRYPQRGLELAEDAAQRAQTAGEGVEAVLDEIDGEKEYIRQEGEVIALRERGEELLRRVASLSVDSEIIVSAATELIREADLALSEGNIRLQQARNELESERFEVARERLSQAGNALSQSLSYREDPAVRDLIDETIPEIGEEIIFRQNQVIVREVRQLITRGKELFFQEKFIEAEQVLNRAQSRWRLTHSEDEADVNLWLTRVKRALEATSGITIEEVDPLYADMMQVLNLAKEDYEKGIARYEADRNAEAIKFFQSAEQKIEYIKEPFPNNQAASVLYLKILQYTQPDDFDSVLRGRFNTAEEKLDTSPEEAYRELQVLQDIRSDYPGLSDAIYRAEIAIGIRQPPPDPQKLARARELYADAENIFQRDIRAQFPIALSYLNEAIKLDPDYREAIVLKDRIQTGQGGQVTVVLSSVDQQKLRRAENLFIDGRYFEAGALVEQLWQNPANRNNPRLVELRRRILSQQ